MMLGMLLLQAGVLAGERSTRFYLGMAAAGYALGLTIRGWRLWAMWKGGFQPEVWEPALAFEAGRLTITLGHLGAILALWRANLLQALAGPLAAMGKMALTNYLGQSLIGAALFYGLGLHGRFDRWQLWAVAAAIWAAQGVFCVWWLGRYRMGPVEWLLRCGSHGALLPIRHPPKTAIQIAA
ncbi:MAG TPA: DUF418 domain-containing protein, partial [Phenylobacterium sp.]|nr:DUF418 domain-containing protein [Phenylobacterium sp.]